MRLLLLVANKRQLDSPIVRQVHLAPLGVVKFSFREGEVACLGKISLAVPEAQIASRIAAVSKLKLPPKVEEQLFPRRNRSQRPSRTGAGSAAHERCHATPGRLGHQ